MPRTGRGETGGICCHVLNRGNGRQTVFHDEDDYAGFVELMGLACAPAPMRVLAWCLMPNHFHLLLWLRADGDLGRWMQWLMTSHVRGYHRRYRGSGHVWQGRFKSFPLERRRPTAAQQAAGVIETACPLWTVARYVERNPLRARLVRRAEEWAWSSLRYSAQLAAPPGWVGRQLVVGASRRLAGDGERRGARGGPGGRASEHCSRPAAGLGGVGTPRRGHSGPGILPPPPRKAKKGARKIACPL